jgi:hypothetical protein
MPRHDDAGLDHLSLATRQQVKFISVNIEMSLDTGTIFQ